MEIVELPYVNVDDIGRLIIQLMDEDKPICYYQEDIENFVIDPEEIKKGGSGPSYKWVEFLPDKCIGEIK